MKRIQVLICNCGAKYAACVEPYCYTDNEWIKSLKQHVKKGGTVEMMDAQSLRFEKCKCEEMAKMANATPTLF